MTQITAGGNRRQFSARFDGKPTARHSPTLVNRLFSDAQQWTGQRTSLEDRAIKSSEQSPELLVKNLGAIPYYQEQHRKVLGADLNPEGVAKAIAAYERTILSGNSPYDRFNADDKKALSAAAQRGLALFKGRAGCVTCHVSFNFTDENYHNLGVGMDKANPDLGRYMVSKTDEHKGAFKTPTLRDVARRPQYICTTVASQRWKKWWLFTIKAASRISGFRKKYARSVLALRNKKT